jgi:hypothetical protein
MAFMQRISAVFRGCDTQMTLVAEREATRVLSTMAATNKPEPVRGGAMLWQFMQLAFWDSTLCALYNKERGEELDTISRHGAWMKAWL